MIAALVTVALLVIVVCLFWFVRVTDRRGRDDDARRRALLGELERHS